MPPTQIASAFVPITGDNSPLRRTLDNTRNLLKNFVSNVTQGIGQGIGQALFGTIQRGIRAGLELIKTSVQANSNLAESLSKTVVAFGDSAKAILDWSKGSATAFGQSRQQALEAASSFGLLFSTIGIGNKESAEMSRRLVELASDIASINNLEPEEALVKLRAGLVGEVEPLRTVGVLLNAVQVEQEALTSGLAATKDAITEQDKVMARYNLILKQTQKTQGDFARTSQGIANQERILAAQRQDALAQIGAAFAPIYLVILQNINKILQQVSPYGENIIRSLAEGLVRGIIYILPALKAVKDVITYWLKPGSPPRLLPDLDKWGTDAMNVYLQGWSDADFGVLATLGSTIEGIVRSFVSSGDIAENDIVQRIFGTRAAILSAVAQWRNGGFVTEQAIQGIQTAAGPAGTALAGLVRSFFDMEGATRRAAQAQRDLNDVTEAYDRLLNPLNEQLDELNDREQEIRDRQTRSEARRTIRDPRSTANEKRLAQLAIERTRLTAQIDTIEDERRVAVNAAQEKLKARQKELEVAQATYNAQKLLLDQAVETNRLTGEQIEINKKRADEAERIYQAALAYNLAIADTPGKIALLTLELERQKEGSVEYYQILTQIATLRKQLADEQGQTSLIPEDGILPDLADLGVPQWANDLAKELDRAIKDAFGIAGANPEIGDQFLGGLDIFGKDIGPEGAKTEEVSDKVKNFVDTLKDLTTAITKLTGPMEALALVFGETGEQSELAAAQTKEKTDDIAVSVTNTAQILKGIGDKDWPLAFKGLQGATATGLIWIADLLPGTDGSEPKDTSSPISGLKTMGTVFWDLMRIGMISGQAPLVTSYLTFLQWISNQLPRKEGEEPTDMLSPLTDLDKSGESIVGNIFVGLVNGWKTVSEWWTEKMQWLRDMLPFSEPRNPASPLRGLEASGRAIMDMLQKGVDSVDLNLPTPNLNVLAAGANAGRPGRSITIEEGAFVFSGIDANSAVVPSLRDALREFLEDMDANS